MTASTASLSRSRRSIGTVFAVNGLLVGAWAPRIPTVAADLGLRPGSLGLALLGVAVGNLLAARLAGAACHRYGSDRVARAASYGYGVAAVLPGLATNLVTLFLTLAVWGLAMGGQDVAMNAQGVELEVAYGRRIFAGLHALWSVATFVGAFAGGIGAALDLPVPVQQALLAAAVLGAFSVVRTGLLPDRPAAPEVAVDAAGPRRRVFDLRLALLGTAAVSSLLAEGVAIDWSAIYLRTHLDASGIWTASAYAAFCAGMTGGRLVGDRVMDRVGVTRSLAVATVLGGGGLAAGFASGVLVGAVIGFGLAGLGLSIMTPLFFGSAPAPPGPAGRQIAVVTGMGYAGMLLGPSLIGLVAQGTSVAAALWLVPPFIVLAGTLGRAGVHRGGRAPSP